MTGPSYSPAQTSRFTRREWLALLVFLVVCLGTSGLGAWLTNASVKTWFQTLQRPPLSPPDWIFGPVWTVLYICMAVAAWQVWCRRREVDVRGPLALFAAQLALNLSWSALFFYLQNPAAALVDIVVLWALIAATMLSFWRVRRSAGWLMAPYLAWVTFATYLNFGFWALNR